MENWRCVKVYNDDGTGKSKRPIGQAWEKNSVPYVEIGSWTTNVGLKLGVDSGKTYSLDCDGKELGSGLLQFMQELEHTHQDPLLLSAFAKLQRTTRFASSPGRCQFLIQIATADPTPIPKRRCFVTKDPTQAEDGMSFELLGDGQQTVIPPSTCSKEGKYAHFKREWTIGPDQLQEWTLDEFDAFWTWLCANFEEQVEIKSAATPPASIYPADNASLDNIIATIEESQCFADGRRHDFVKGFSALMIQNGIRQEDTEEVVRRLVATYGGDELDLLSVVQYFYRVRYARKRLIRELEAMM